MKILIALCLLIACLLGGSCTHRPGRQLMERADSLMEKHPDSALQLLRQVPVAVLKDDEERACYILLLTRSMANNHLPLTGDSLISTTIRHYEATGNRPLLAQAYFWAGYIKQSAGQNPEALRLYLQAKSLVKGTQEYRLASRISHNLALIYYAQDLNDRADSLCRSNEELARQLGDTALLAETLIQRGMLKIEETPHKLLEAEALMQQAYTLTCLCPDNEKLKKHVAYALAFLYNRMHEGKKAIPYARRYAFLQNDSIRRSTGWQLLGSSFSSNIAYSPANHCFDNENGNFLGVIGHRGSDPEGYSSIVPFYNREKELFYFIRQPNALQKYDKTGKYRGKAIIPMGSSQIPDQFTFKDSLVIGAYEKKIPGSSSTLIVFTETGEITDTISLQDNTLKSNAKKKVGYFWTPLSRLGSVSVMTYQDGQKEIQLSCSQMLWRQGENVHYKTGLNDTIYMLKDGSLQPAYAFHLGKRKITEQTMDKSNGITTTGALESDEIIYFQCASNFIEEPMQKIIQTGIYNKRTGETYMADNDAPLTDDLNGFLPFDIDCCGEGGEFAGILKAEDIVSWLKEHPEAKANPALAPLLKVKEEDNPVVAIVKKTNRIPQNVTSGLQNGGNKQANKHY